MAELAEIIDELEGHLTLLKELGVRKVEVDPSVWHDWAEIPVSPQPPPLLSQPLPVLPSTPLPPTRPSSPPVIKPTPVLPSTGGLSPEAREAELTRIAAEIDACSACPLRAGRTLSVPGRGNSHSPDVMFIGEAPGADEDRQGIPFVGAAGQFLTKMIQAMGYTREEVFIANICKCRPPGNRTPTPGEMATCFPFLKRQISIIRPKTIVLLGGTAIKAILNTQVGVTRLQGSWSRFENIPVMPTYHPSYIIRFERGGPSPALNKVKHEVWNALKKVLAYLGKPIPNAKKKSTGE